MIRYLKKISNFPLKGRFDYYLGLRLFNKPQFFSYQLFNKLSENFFLNN